MVPSKSNCSVDLLISEFSTRCLAFLGRTTFFVDNLRFWSNTRSREITVVDFFDNEVGGNVNELTDAVVEAFAPRSRQHGLVRNMTQVEYLGEFLIPSQCSITVTGDLSLDEESDHPEKRIRSGVPLGIRVIKYFSSNRAPGDT